MKNSTVIVSHNTTGAPSIRIDLAIQVGNFTPEEYYSAFVDLYIAIGARCLSFGVGNYAYLVAKIFSTPCLQVHEVFRKAQNVYNSSGATLNIMRAASYSIT